MTGPDRPVRQPANARANGLLIAATSDLIVAGSRPPHRRGRRGITRAHVLPPGASPRGTFAGRVSRRRPVRIRNRPILDLHAAPRRVELERTDREVTTCSSRCCRSRRWPRRSFGWREPHIATGSSRASLPNEGRHLDPPLVSPATCRNSGFRLCRHRSDQELGARAPTFGPRRCLYV